MKRLLSGITPSGDGTLHIGNYLGAVRQFKELAHPSAGSHTEAHDCFLMVADLHALTTVQNQAVLQRNIEMLILNELALLGDLTNITFFRQSDVMEHTALQSILNNYTPLGLIKRAHAYKDKLQHDIVEDDINMGLFNYPV
jgi:tryptophanyl-tRNA synthetase